MRKLTHKIIPNCEVTNLKYAKARGDPAIIFIQTCKHKVGKSCFVVLIFSHN